MDPGLLLATVGARGTVCTVVKQVGLAIDPSRVATAHDLLSDSAIKPRVRYMAVNRPQFLWSNGSEIELDGLNNLRVLECRADWMGVGLHHWLPPVLEIRCLQDGRAYRSDPTD